MSEFEKHCPRCKRTFTSAESYGSHKICQVCYDKQTGAQKAQIAREKKQEEEANKYDNLVPKEPIVEAKATRARPKRIPLHEQNPLDVVGKDPNRVYRWVNDKDGRIERLALAGWIVEQEQGRAVKEIIDSMNYKSGSGSAISRHMGRGTMGVLMSIDKDLYDEDMLTIQERNSTLEQSILEGTMGAQDNFYTKKSLHSVKSSLHSLQVKPG